MPPQPVGTPNPESLLKAITTHLLQFALKILMVRIRLLPTVIFFSVLLLGVKVQHVTHKIKNGFDVSMTTVQAADVGGGPAAHAKESNSIDPTGMSSEEYKLLQEMHMKKDVAAPAPAPSPSDASAPAAPSNTAAATSAEQPAVLKALENRMNETVKQLNTSQTELKTLFKNIDQEENANTKRLIKMVEGMKPDQASKVLEGIEFKILLEIMEGMSEKKASPILASMAPEKASYLMTALAKRKRIIQKDNPTKGVMTN